MKETISVSSKLKDNLENECRNLLIDIINNTDDEEKRLEIFNRFQNIEMANKVKNHKYDLLNREEVIAMCYLCPEKMAVPQFYWPEHHCIIMTYQEACNLLIERYEISDFDEYSVISYKDYFEYLLHRDSRIPILYRKSWIDRCREFQSESDEDRARFCGMCGCIGGCNLCYDVDNIPPQYIIDDTKL